MSDFRIEDGVLKEYLGAGGKVEIPDGVTSIGNNAFYNCGKLTSVTIPDSVTHIGWWAFKGCGKLSRVVIPDSVKEIERAVFNGCKKLADADGFVIVNGVLYDYFGSDSSVTIPAGVTRIDEDAFYTKAILKNVTVTEGVKSIGRSAFCRCENLQSVSLPNGLEQIGDEAFNGCRNLRSIAVPDSVTEIGDEAFRSCDSIADADGFVIVRNVLWYYCGKSRKPVIPAGVTTIGRNAFISADKITSVTLPDGIQSIRPNAFANCSLLASVNFPDSLQSIGKFAFARCESLYGISIPESVATIADDAFTGCRGLADADGFLVIGDTLQCYCGSTAEAVIPDGVRRIADFAFDNCRILKELGIPASVTQMTDFAFRNCSGLEKISASAENPVLASADGVLMKKDGSEIIYCPRAKQGHFVIPDGTKTIGIRAFFECRELTEITIPVSVSSIKDQAFQCCEKLERVAIPDGVTVLANKAFSDCHCLTEVALPDTLTAIGMSAFHYCDKLTKITIPDSVRQIGMGAFDNCTSIKEITVPGGVSNIEDRAFSCCFALARVTLCDGVRRIGENAFSLCDLREITIPDSVDQIETSAFKDDNYIKVVRISPQVLAKTKSVELWCPAVNALPAESLLPLMNKCPEFCSSVVEDRILSLDSYKAAAFFERKGNLDRYLSAHSDDTDPIERRTPPTFGLDRDGGRRFVLGGKEYTARAEHNLSLTILDAAGKVQKSLPKKGADPEEYAAVKEELDELKSGLTTAAKLRAGCLLTDFLEDRARPAKEWKAEYLANPILRKMAECLIWQQGEQTFILNADGQPVDAGGAPVALNDAPIRLAHPMDLSAECTQAWRDHLVKNRLPQPFAQIWEPTFDSGSITPDRYKGLLAERSYLEKGRLHGIGLDYGRPPELRDCSAAARSEMVLLGRSTPMVEIQDFRIEKNSRYANHIVACIDKWTVQYSLMTDDASAKRLFDRFTAAQIAGFIRLIETKSNCRKALAVLQAYMAEICPEAGDFTEFVLDLV